MSYGDYVEQLTYLLFLKMADEQEREFGKVSTIPAEYSWVSLRGLEGAELDRHYRTVLAELGRGSGLIPVIFRKAQSRIQDPAKLSRLIILIDGETWTGLGIDVKGEIYEGLLEKNAQDIKSGAGQYFTPCPLIRAMVDAFVACYNPANRHDRTPTWSEETPEGRWRAFPYEELMARDKVNLDVF
jgi:type I restriction enzyme M protein